MIKEFWRNFKLHESMMCQKSRIKWVREGDANTNVFHGVVNWRKRSNCIKGLEVDRVWCGDPVKSIAKRNSKRRVICKFC